MKTLLRILADPLASARTPGIEERTLARAVDAHDLQLARAVDAHDLQVRLLVLERARG